MNPAIGTVVLCLLLAGASCDTEARERSSDDRTSPAPMERTRPTETPPGTQGTATDQTRVGGKTLGEWRALPRDEFAREMQTYVATLDERIGAANEAVRAELTEKRDEVRQSLTDLRAATATAWEDTRSKVLDAVHSIESRLERR